MKSAFDKTALVVAVVSPFEPEASNLLAQLRAELVEKYPDELEGTPFRPEQLAVSGAVFLMARISERAIGCGAFRPLEPGVAEVKRMFVVPKARGLGVGREILQELESTAGVMGYTSLQLETGLRQPEAIGLYESAGYRRVPCYGKYADNPMSVCFEKLLRQRRGETEG